MTQKCFIVNADDCGMSTIVNEHIANAIEAGRITSTTVMANMDDFDGAVALNKEYGSRISFGWHINLTEGEPLLKSQLLLDTGYYVERSNHLEFNGKVFWHKRLSGEMKSEIRKELIEQYTRIKDSGISISHADSHHHIHTSLALMFFVPSLLQELGITRMRRMRNYVPYSFSYMARKAVSGIVSMRNRRIKQADTFCYFREYLANPHLPQGNIIEMECHPGNPGYMEEEKLLMETDLSLKFGGNMISYSSL